MTGGGCLSQKIPAAAKWVLFKKKRHTLIEFSTVMETIQFFVLQRIDRKEVGFSLNGLITTGCSHVEGSSPHHTSACSRGAQLFGLDGAANIGCKKRKQLCKQIDTYAQTETTVAASGAKQ